MRSALLPFLLLLSACSTLGRGPAALPEQPGYLVITRDPQSPFAKVKQPTPGAPQVYGEYARGCFAGGVAMPLVGDGFAMVNTDRNRYYGHPILISLLMGAGKELGDEFPLLIGDLSQPRGGPTPTGHSSHQSGLDADIWFSKIARQDLEPRTLQKNGTTPTVLRTEDAGKEKAFLSLNPDLWRPHYVAQLKWFSERPEVVRIFVNAVIKRELCQKYPNEQWLTKLRPWAGHDDHFHIRLHCPADQPDCINQSPIETLGCDPKDFEDWLSPKTIAKLKADHEGKGEVTQPKPLNLPIQCKDIVEK